MKKKVFLIAISSKINERELDFAIERCKNMGFDSIYSDKILNNYLGYAGSLQDRIFQVHEAFSSDADFIFLVKGGRGINHLLPYLDFKLIKKKFKPVVGYSDITILLNYIYAEFGLKTIHGPNMLKKFPENDESLSCLINVLNGSDFALDFSEEDIIVKGRAEGEIMGGNMWLLVRSLGTPYEINVLGKILFLEAVEKSGQEIYDHLEQLRQAGKFDNCKAVLLGSFKDCPEADVYLKEFFKNFNIPVVMNQPFGHDVPNYAIPLGANCIVDTFKQFWQIKQNQPN